jgi:hypothetical protein
MKYCFIFILITLFTSSLLAGVLPMKNILFEKKIILNLDQTIEFQGGNKVTLKYFTHKRPRTGGPTKASAQLVLETDKGKEDLELSITGTDGKPDRKYSDLFHGDFLFLLTGWNYNESVEFTITRFATHVVEYGKRFELKVDGPVALFNDNLKLWVTEHGSDHNQSGTQTRYANLSFLRDSEGSLYKIKIYENGSFTYAGHVLKLLNIGPTSVQFIMEQ